jgi:hypothetical protein
MEAYAVGSRQWRREGGLEENRAELSTRCTHSHEWGFCRRTCSRPRRILAEAGSSLPERTSTSYYILVLVAPCSMLQLEPRSNRALLRSEDTPVPWTLHIWILSVGLPCYSLPPGSSLLPLFFGFSTIQLGGESVCDNAFHISAYFSAGNASPQNL